MKQALPWIALAVLVSAVLIWSFRVPDFGGAKFVPELSVPEPGVPAGGEHDPDARAGAPEPSSGGVGVDEGQGASAEREPAGPTGPSQVLVRCRWRSDGAPASGVSVRCEPGRDRALADRRVTDADGEVRFVGLAANENAFRVGGAEQRATPTPGGVRELVFELVDAVQVTGRVLDAAGQPVAGAAVCRARSGEVVALAASGADGTFSLRSMAPCGIWAQRTGYLSSEIVALVLGANRIELQLADADGRLDGCVVDPDGAPVVGAMVAIALDAESHRPKRAPVVLRTDERGAFTTADVPRAQLQVFAHADGFAFGEQGADTTPAGSGTVVVRLRRPASVFGVLRGGADGGPLAETAMLVFRQRDQRGLLQGMSDRLTRFDAVTGAQGRYRFDALPPGRMWVVAMVQPAPVNENVELAEGEQREWSPDLSRPSGVVRGELRGPDGAPLADWVVTAMRLDKISMQHERMDATTGTDGGFVLEGLRDAPHTLTARKFGGDVARRDGVAPGGPAIVWQLRAVPEHAGAIAVRVRGPDGAPIDDLSLRAVDEDGISRRATAGGQPDAFRLDDLLPGVWTVWVESKAYGRLLFGECTVAADATTDLGERRLPEHGTFAVRLVGDGIDREHVELQLVQRLGGVRRRHDLVRDGQSWRSPPLPPGSYRLCACGRDFALSDRDVEIATGVERTLDLQAAPAVTVAFEFVPEGLSEPAWRDFVSIVLRDADGRERFERTVAVREGTSLHLPIGLAPGRYVVEADSAQVAWRVGRREFVVPAETDEPLPVRVDMRVQKR